MPPARTGESQPRGATSHLAFLANNAVVTAAFAIALGANFVLTIVMGRMLPPAEFGALGLLVAIFLFFSLPSGALQVLIVRRATKWEQAGTPEKTREFVRRFGARVAILGACLVVVAAAVQGPVAALFKLTSGWPIVTITGAIALWLLLTVNRGAMQAHRDFVQLSANLVAEAVLRVGGATLLVFFWRDAQAAALAILLACAAAYLLTLPVLGRIPKPAAAGDDEPLPGIREIGGLLVALTLAAAMQNADLFAAKARLDPAAAGQYVAAATIAKAIFFLSLAVTTAMLPDASAARGDPQRIRVLKLSAGMVLAMSVPAVAVFFGAGDSILSAIYGPDRAEMSAWLGPLAIAATLFSLAFLELSYLAALERLRYLPVLFGGALIEAVALVAVAKSSVGRIVAVVIAINGALALALGADAVIEHRAEDRPRDN